MTNVESSDIGEKTTYLMDCHHPVQNASTRSLEMKIFETIFKMQKIEKSHMIPIIEKSQMIPAKPKLLYHLARHA